MTCIEEGAYVRIVKLSKNPGLEPNYTVEGKLVRPLVVGEPVLMLRFARNGIARIGIFETSPVRAFLAPETGKKTHFYTENSTYSIELTKKPYVLKPFNPEFPGGSAA